MSLPSTGHSVLPTELGDFPGIPYEFTEVLKTRGILNTIHFLEATQKKGDRSRLAAATGIPVHRLEELHALCRLTRIPGIDAPLARVLYHAGIRSVNELANGAVDAIRQKLNRRGNTYPEITGSLKDEALQKILQHAKAIRESDRENEAQE